MIVTRQHLLSHFAEGVEGRQAGADRGRNRTGVLQSDQFHSSGAPLKVQNWPVCPNGTAGRRGVPHETGEAASSRSDTAELADNMADAVTYLP